MWRAARWPFALALAIAGLAHVARPFDGLYGQDAFAYFRFARAIWPHWRHGAPLPLLFWPRGYPAAVALLLPFTGGSPLAGQLVSALACAWAAAATFLLVRELQRARGDAGDVGDPTARVVAGATVAASGIALRTSQVVMADGLTIGLAATALWCTARALRTGRIAWLVPCAVAVAWGAVTRWQDGLLAFPLAAALVIGRRARGPASQPVVTGAALRWYAAAGAAGLLVLLPQLMAAHAVPKALENHEWLLRWSPLNALRRDFQTSEGHARYRFPVALFYRPAPRLAGRPVPDGGGARPGGRRDGGPRATRHRDRAPHRLAAVNWAFISGHPLREPALRLARAAGDRGPGGLRLPAVRRSSGPSAVRSPFDFGRAVRVLVGRRACCSPSASTRARWRARRATAPSSAGSTPWSRQTRRSGAPAEP